MYTANFATSFLKDFAKHIGTRTHKKIVESAKGTLNIKTALLKSSQEKKQNLALQIVNAEAIMCHQLIAGGNLSFSSVEWMLPALKGNGAGLLDGGLDV